MTMFEEYYGFMADYTDFYRDVQRAEYEKLEALLSNNLERMDEAMKNYQSCIKKAQQLEHERIEMCMRMGFEDMAFSTICKKFPDDEKYKLIEQKNDLERLVKSIKYLNRKSIDLANMQLSITNPDSTAFYNAKGEQESPLAKSSILNKQV